MIEATHESLSDYQVIAMTKDEMIDIQGGFIWVAPFLACGAVAAAGVAIYECGKAIGECVYYATHAPKKK